MSHGTDEIRPIDDRPRAFFDPTSCDSNAFVLLGQATRAMRRAKWSKAEIDDFTRRATSGDYDNLIRVVLEHTHAPGDV